MTRERKRASFYQLQRSMMYQFSRIVHKSSCQDDCFGKVPASYRPRFGIAPNGEQTSVSGIWVFRLICGASWSVRLLRLVTVRRPGHLRGGHLHTACSMYSKCYLRPFGPLQWGCTQLPARVSPVGFSFLCTTVPVQPVVPVVILGRGRPTFAQTQPPLAARIQLDAPNCRSRAPPTSL